jgi:hypothetical protein
MKIRIVILNSTLVESSDEIEVEFWISFVTAELNDQILRWAQYFAILAQHSLIHELSLSSRIVILNYHTKC